MHLDSRRKLEARRIGVGVALGWAQSTGAERRAIASPSPPTLATVRSVWRSPRLRDVLLAADRTGGGRLFCPSDPQFIFGAGRPE